VVGLFALAKAVGILLQDAYRKATDKPHFETLLPKE
jgi:hypothetical protein